MGPGSRGRSHKRRHRQQSVHRRTPHRRAPSTAAGPPGLFAAVVGDVDPLLRRILGGPAALVPDDDPTDAEFAGAAFVSMAALTIGDPMAGVTAGGTLEAVLLSDVIPSFERASTPMAPAVVLGLGSVAGGRVAAASAAAVERMVAAGAHRPVWSPELAGPLRAGGCHRLIAADGTPVGFGFSVARAGWTRSVECYLDRTDGRLIRTYLTFLVGVGSPAHEQQLGVRRHLHEAIRAVREDVPPAGFRAIVEDALERSDAHDRHRPTPLIDPFVFAGEHLSLTGASPIDDAPASPLTRTVTPLLRAWMRSLPREIRRLQ